ncbi:MAG TPA: hypothetical protein DCQ06_05050, partial [Myxococcales bacterium]|nr:hypothetical protein [Myxococcales bacterium]
MTQPMRRRWLLSVSVMLCIIVVLELWARTRVADWQGILGAIVLTDDGNPPCFRLRPDASGVYDGWLQSIAATHFHIDSRGLRVDAEQPVTGKATERLALVGDSHIFGLGVNFQDTLGATLERALVRGHDKAQGRCLTAACSPAVEVLNLGVPGYDFDGMVTRVTETVPALSPSVLVIAIGANDLPQRMCGQHSKPARSMFRYSALGRVALAAIYKAERSEARCDADELRRVNKGLAQMSRATPQARRVIVSLSPLCHDEAAQALRVAASKA